MKLHINCAIISRRLQNYTHSYIRQVYYKTHMRTRERNIAVERIISRLHKNIRLSLEKKIKVVNPTHNQHILHKWLVNGYIRCVINIYNSLGTTKCTEPLHKQVLSDEMKIHIVCAAMSS